MKVEKWNEAPTPGEIAGLNDLAGRYSECSFLVLMSD